MWSLLPEFLLGLGALYLLLSTWMSGACYTAIQEDWQYWSRPPGWGMHLWVIFCLVALWPVLIWGLSDRPGSKTASRILLLVFRVEDR